MKKLLVLLVSLLMFVGCSSSDTTEPTPTPEGNTGGNVEIEKLSIQFVPSRDPQTITTATDPLKELLIAELAKKGFDVGAVEISTGADYNAAGEALTTGAVDLAFLPAGTYVMYHEDGAELLLTATRAGLSKDSENAKDWNDGKPTEGDSSNQVTYYRSIGVTAPTEVGMALATKVNNGEELTWEDVNAANWCVSKSTSSSAGYVYPQLWLKEKFGKAIIDLNSAIPTDGYSDSAARLANGQCDIAVGYADFRRDYAENWTTDYGREKTIWEETNTVLVTDGVMNDTISYSANSEIMTPELVTALQDIFMNIASTETGKKVIAIYSHEGYKMSKDSDYDAARAAQEESRK